MMFFHAKTFCIISLDIYEKVELIYRWRSICRGIMGIWGFLELLRMLLWLMGNCTNLTTLTNSRPRRLIHAVQVLGGGGWPNELHMFCRGIHSGRMVLNAFNSILLAILKNIFSKKIIAMSKNYLLRWPKWTTPSQDYVIGGVDGESGLRT